MDLTDPAGEQMQVPDTKQENKGLCIPFAELAEHIRHNSTSSNSSGSRERTSALRDKPHPRLDPAYAKEVSQPRPMSLESPNARSISITIADGPNTGGALNRHPSQATLFQVGIVEDKGTRRTMEDAHSFVVDFDNVRGQGYFGLFDGHAGKHAAEWCGQHFHEYLLDALRVKPNLSIPEILNSTFHAVDTQLSRMAQEQKTHSGCTAVTTFLRWEDAHGGQSFLKDQQQHSSQSLLTHRNDTTSPAPALEPDHSLSPEPAESGHTTASGGLRIRNAVKSIANRLSSSFTANPLSPSPIRIVNGAKHSPFEPQEGGAGLRKVLYAANAGDSRAVLCRGGEALRLTYDHKGNDPQEMRRIQNAGGFMMNNRVNGVLAVTRSLGDSSMKDYVVGSPYTTETELCDADEFLIIACDGLWDVCDDQEAVELVRHVLDAQTMAKKLLDHALAKSSTDNVTVVVVRFRHKKIGIVMNKENNWITVVSNGAAGGSKM